MGVPQSLPEAIKWFKKAAAQGHAEAQESLQKLQELNDHLTGGGAATNTPTAVTTAVTLLSGKCGNCRAAASQRCIRCKAVQYCSSECQKQHWKGGHKRVCSLRRG